MFHCLSIIFLTIILAVSPVAQALQNSMDNRHMETMADTVEARMDLCEHCDQPDSCCDSHLIHQVCNAGCLVLSCSGFFAIPIDYFPPVFLQQQNRIPTFSDFYSSHTPSPEPHPPKLYYY